MFVMEIVPCNKKWCRLERLDDHDPPDYYFVTVREGTKMLYTRKCTSKKALRRYVTWHQRRHGKPFVGVVCSIRGGLEKMGLDDLVRL